MRWTITRSFIQTTLEKLIIIDIDSLHKRTQDILISLVHRDNVVKEVMKRVPYHLTMTKKANRVLYRVCVCVYVLN